MTWTVSVRLVRRASGVGTGVRVLSVRTVIGTGNRDVDVVVFLAKGCVVVADSDPTGHDLRDEAPPDGDLP